MLKSSISVIFDRRKTAEKTGKGAVEIRIYLGDGVRKYVQVGTTTRTGWKTYKNSKEIAIQMEKYQNIVTAMQVLGEDMTLENFQYHLDGESHKTKTNGMNRNFIEYIKEELKKEELREGTYRHKVHVIETLECYGKLKTFADLTPKKIKEFDKWLHDTGERTNVTIWDYHKRVRKYTRKLWMDELIPQDPYKLCKFDRGHSKVRTPLTESELLLIRCIDLDPSLDRVRDLFIFAAYTGLAYVDVDAFDFASMVRKSGDKLYIESKRTKTSTLYYTPILKPAMEVLEKYDYKLPKISNQKANAYLHVIQHLCGIKKSLTFHLARHSFATMALAHDIPIENVARMLGHTDIKTTQIYAKILNTSIERHSLNLDNVIL